MRMNGHCDQLKFDVRIHFGYKIKSNQIKFICDKNKHNVIHKKTKQVCRQDTKAVWNCTNKCPKNKNTTTKKCQMIRSMVYGSREPPLYCTVVIDLDYDKSSGRLDRLYLFIILCFKFVTQRKQRKQRKR